MKRSVIEKLALIFNVSPAYLMGWESTKTPSPAVGSVSFYAGNHPPREEILLKNYRDLNVEGRDKVDDDTNDLVSSRNYKKISENGMVVEKKSINKFTYLYRGYFPAAKLKILQTGRYNQAELWI